MLTTQSSRTFSVSSLSSIPLGSYSWVFCLYAQKWQVHMNESINDRHL